MDAEVQVRLLWSIGHSAEFRFAPSQWETVLLCNDFSHWLGANLESDLGHSPHRHDDVIKWKHFPRNWPFVRGIHRSPVNSPYKGQWRGVLRFSLICNRINGWVNNREAGYLRRHRAHYDVMVMIDTGDPSSTVGHWMISFIHNLINMFPLILLCCGQYWITFDRDLLTIFFIWWFTIYPIRYTRGFVLVWYENIFGRSITIHFHFVKYYTSFSRYIMLDV